MNLEDNYIKGSQILTKLLISGETIDITANGLSMFPFLLPSDILRVMHVSPQSLKRGQIVIYKSNNKFICHRYIKTVNKTILCKGDGLINYDAPILPENILGIVIARTRNNKTKSLTSTMSKITGYLQSLTTGATGIFFHHASFIWHKWISNS